MTINKMIEWAVDQHDLSIQQKLGLVALAIHAGADGGGRITIRKMAQAAGCSLLEAMGLALELQSLGKVIVRYLPAHNSETAADDHIAFGLCMEGPGSS